MLNYNRLTINLAAVFHNLTLIKQHLPSTTRIMPMVKASAYGTDAWQLSSFFSSCGIDIVGVSHVDEALFLRQKGITTPLFVIGSEPDQAKEIVSHDLEVGLSDTTLLEALVIECQKQNKSVKVHLHVDTGMKRFGCSPEEARVLAKRINAEKNIVFEGLMTHFIAAESSKYDSFSKKQIKLFEKITHSLKKENLHPKWIHAQNSAAAFRFTLPFCNMVRTGLAPLGYLEVKTPSLEPALTLESTILGINFCKKRDSVGYNKGYVVKKDKERIAIIPIGYHDGLRINFSGKGYALVHGLKAPFVGRICMDFMMINITDIPQAKIGDKVLLFGKDHLGNNLPLEVFASFVKTNVREVISTLGPRIARVFVPPDEMS